MNPVTKSFQAINTGLKRFAMVFARSTVASWSYFLSPRTRYDYAGAVGNGTGNSAVMAALAWIGRAFPEAPVQVQRPKADEYEPIAGHPLTELLEQPNPYYSGAVMWSATLTAFHTDGNAYWIKERAAAGRVVALWYTPPELIEPVSESEAAFIEYYRYSPGGREIRLAPSEVVHFRNGLDPENPRIGRAPLKAALREVFADDEAALFAGALMRNMGIPGVLISPDGDGVELSPDDAELVKSSFLERFGGDNRGAPMVMSGKTKVEVLSFSPEQLNLRELRRLPEERITAVLGIPAIVAGLGAGLDRSTFANYAEAREAAWEDNIIPTQRALAADLKVQLLRDFDENPALRVAFDTSNVRVLQPDQTAIYARTIQAVQAGVITVAEGRREIGKPAGPEHEFYMIPSGYEVRAELEAPELEPLDVTTPFDAMPPGMGADAGEDEGDTNEPGDEPRLRVVRALAAGERKSIAGHTERIERLATRFERQLRGYFGDQERAVLATWRAGQPKAIGAVALKVDAADLLGPEWDSVLYQLAAGFFQATGAEAAALAAEQLRMPNLFDLALDRIEATAARLATRVVRVNETTRQRLRETITRGFDAGETLDQIAQSIRGVMTDASTARARAIARTESANALNLSTTDAYEASGLVFEVDVVDGDEDEACAAVNGQRWPLARSRTEPIAHPNCTRGFLPVVTRRGSGSGRG